MRAVGPILAVLILIGLIISGTLYTVDQRQNAIVFQLGEIKDVVEKPGLHFKWPLLQNVRHFDMRILTYDDAEPLRFLTQGNRPVLVDSFVKWHIIDAKQYYVSVQGDEFRAQTRIRQTVSGTLRDEFGIRGVHEVVSGEREQIMARVREKVDQDLKRIGVGIIDVRLKRVDLPQEVSETHAEPRVLLVLPQHGGVPLDLPRPQRHHAARDQLGLPALLQGLAGTPGHSEEVSDGHDVPDGVRPDAGARRGAAFRRAQPLARNLPARHADDRRPDPLRRPVVDHRRPAAPPLGTLVKGVLP